MGAYNLLDIKIKCAKCSNEFLGKLQFKVGEVWQYEYKIGDVLKIKSEDTELVGREVVAYGILEDAICPFCGFPNESEYDIFINDLIIQRYSVMTDYSPYQTRDGGDYYLQ